MYLFLGVGNYNLIKDKILFNIYNSFTIIVFLINKLNFQPQRN